MGADCSERVCQFSRSYIDTPQGDLNSDGFLDKAAVKTVILGASRSFWMDTIGNACDGTAGTANDDAGDSCSCDAPGCIAYTGDGSSTSAWFTTYYGTAIATATAGVQTAAKPEEIMLSATPPSEVTALSDESSKIAVVECADGSGATVRAVKAVGENAVGAATGIDTGTSFAGADIGTPSAANAIGVPNYLNGDDCASGGTAKFSNQEVKFYSQRVNYLASNVYASDEFSTDRDPYGFVSACNTLYPDARNNAGSSATDVITHAIKVEVSADTFTTPEAFAEALMYVPRFKGVAVDKTGAVELNDIRSDIDTNDDGTLALTKMMVCAVSGTTYDTQWSPKKEWERFPDDHGVGKATHDVASKYDEAHFFKECAGKGQCDRSTGVCECYPGWEGSGCKRSACPEGCSGHGFCKRIADVTDNYLGWDAYHSQSCVCEPGYEGVDCSLRSCPMGHDPIHRGLLDEVQTITLHDYRNLVGPGSAADLGDHASMALVFTDEMGDEWVTPSFLIKPKGVTATVTFSSFSPVGGMEITEAGSGYDPSDSLDNTALVSGVTGTTCVATDFLPIINADGQLSGVDVSQDSTCAAVPVLTMNAPPAVNTYRSFWYGAKNMAAALEALPNNVVPAVTVSVDCGNVNADDNDGAGAGEFRDGSGVYSSADDACGADSSTAAESHNSKDVRFHVTFTDNSGDIPPLGVRFGNSQVRGMPDTAATFSQSWKFSEDDTNDESRWNCARGAKSGADTDDVCEPRQVANFGVTGFTTEDAALGWVDGLLTLSESVKGTKYNEVCSRRGLCDYGTGECKCFAGFTDVDCHVQNALAMG